jgi:O-antigen/teichoic acid export membrane protein
MLPTDTASTPETRLTDRIAVRSGASLVSNGIRLGLSFGSGLMIARGLGAAGYGEYQFLLASVGSLAQFLDLGTSQAFFTFLSRQQRTRRFFLLYGGWLAAQFALVLLAIAAVIPASVLQRLWLQSDRWAIVLAFVATFLMNELWEAVAQLGEAQRRTVVVQSALVVQTAAHVALIAVFLIAGRLTVAAVFTFLIVEYGGLVVVLGPRFLAANHGDVAAPGESGREIVGEFYRYCRPLVLYAWCSFVFLFADRWLLQRFGGANQQGFFSIGQQFSTVSLLAATSMMQVFWKEIAAATNAGDRVRAASLYQAASRALYFVAAWVGCLIVPYSREILALTVGGAYAAAAVPFGLMLLYPAHQALGRVTAAFLYASGETGLYSRLGVIALAASLPIAYALLATRDAALPGLGLGAVGLAIKLIAVNVASVNLQASAIARRLGIAYDWGHQVLTLGGLLALAFACRALVDLLVGVSISPRGIAAAAAGGLLYACASLALVLRRPGVVGLTRGQVDSIAGAYLQLAGMRKAVSSSW